MTITNPRRGSRARSFNQQSYRGTTGTTGRARVHQERINPKITVISDSICKRITITGVEFQVVSGLNIDKCFQYIEQGERLKVTGYDIIVLHIGTVELRRETADSFATRLQELIKLIRLVNTDCHIGLSSILPRPIDFHSGRLGRESEVKRLEFNAEIKRVALWERCSFLRTYKPFLDRQDQTLPDESLFRRIRIDGVHLNWYGSRQLENYLSGSIALMKGRWRQSR